MPKFVITAAIVIEAAHADAAGRCAEYILDDLADRDFGDDIVRVRGEFIDIEEVTG